MPKELVFYGTYSSLFLFMLNIMIWEDASGLIGKKLKELE